MTTPLFWKGAAWGILVLLSMAGWGAAINWLVMRVHRADLGWCAAWGVGLIACLGGVLDLLHLVSPAAVFTTVACGLALLMLLRARWPTTPWMPKSDRVALVFLILAFVLVAVRYAGSVLGASFNAHDDFYAYFVFPAKMLQTGSIGEDPFNLRRQLTSFGGQAFLQSLLLAALPFRGQHLLEVGIGTILVAAVLFGHLRSSGGGRLASVLPLLAFLAVREPVVNTSSEVVGLALFLSFFRVVSMDRAGILTKPLLIALHVAAICSLKSSFIPACLSLAGASYILEMLDKFSSRQIYSLLLASFVSATLLLPWMVESYRFTGTALYPLLGKGYGAYAYGAFASPYGRFDAKGVLKQAPVFPLAAMILLPLASGLCRRDRWRENKARIALFAASVAGCVAVEIALNGYDPYRFVYPFLFTTILVELGYSLSSERRSRWQAVGVIAILALASWKTNVVASYRTDLRNATRGSAPVGDGYPDVPDGELRYSKLQESAPSGATILARLSRPFLLDFRRNRIYNVDLPGGSASRSGMPFFEGGEALARYLLAISIRYVAYDYRAEAGFPRFRFESRLLPVEERRGCASFQTPPSCSSFSRVAALLTFDFQKNLEELGRTRRRIYDDGSVFMLDLLQGDATSAEKVN